MCRSLVRFQDLKTALREAVMSFGEGAFLHILFVERRLLQQGEGARSLRFLWIFGCESSPISRNVRTLVNQLVS